MDDDLGVAVLDRFTWALLEFTKNVNSTSLATISDLFKSLDPKFLNSHPNLKQTDGARSPFEAKVVDFFGNVRAVDYKVPAIDIKESSSSSSIILKSKFTINLESTTVTLDSGWYKKMMMMMIPLFTTCPDRLYFSLKRPVNNYFEGRPLYSIAALAIVLLLLTIVKGNWLWIKKKSQR